MEFLSPAFLIGALAAAVPLLIHLIRRQKPPRLPFGSIRFLKQTSKRLVLFQQLRQWLLLLLRTALVVLLALAFARPLLDRSVVTVLDAAPRSVVILVDVSMSMGYGEVMAAAKEAALALLDGSGRAVEIANAEAISSSDEVALIAFASQPQVLQELQGPQRGLAPLRREIEALQPLDASTDAPIDAATDYLAALRLADLLLESSQHSRRMVYLISDFQDSGFDRQAAADFMLTPGTGFTGINVGVEESLNLAITDLRAPDYLLAESGPQTLLARVRSTGSILAGTLNDATDIGQISLLLDDEVVAQHALQLDDRSEQVVTFEVPFPAEGIYQGELRLDGIADDRLPADDSYPFTVEVLPRVRVLVVNGEASRDWFDDEGHWFGLAVAANGASPFLLQSMQPAALSTADLQQQDVVVLLNVGSGSSVSGPRVLADTQAAAIVDYVQGGGAVLFAPGDRVQRQDFNRQFAAVAPARLEESALLGRDEYLLIGDYDRRHPIMSPLDSDWSARFRGKWALTPAADAEILMRFDSAEPALLERTVGDGKTILFASSLDLEWNNLALQGLYLPFVHQILHYMTAPDTATRDTPPATPPRESELAAIDVATLHDAVINPNTAPVQSPQARATLRKAEAERPQRLWWWLLILALLLAIIETPLANRTHR